MSVRVNIHQNLQDFTNGQVTAEVTGNTVGECLYDLVQQFPGIEARLFDKKGKLLNYVDIYVNLESSFPKELAMPVKDGDELSITLLIVGG
jgi:molybdopterin converting factor small subunit